MPVQMPPSARAAAYGPDESKRAAQMTQWMLANDATFLVLADKVEATRLTARELLACILSIRLDEEELTNEEVAWRCENFVKHRHR